MKPLIALLTAAALLSACGALPTAPSTPRVSTALDAASLGGLTDAHAAHVSVQLGTPGAYALSPQARPFLQALERVVAPQRETLAERLAADATVQAGLASWERSTASQQLAVLKRVAAIQAGVMAIEMPGITMQAGSAAQSGTTAYFLPGSGAGRVILYQDALERGGKYMAVSAVVHEMRHAAQYQLVQAGQSLLAGLDADRRALASAYAASWEAIDALGGQATMAYGDYAHLNVEYDAFQTGNAVAARLSGGTYEALGFGFVDTHYDDGGAVSLDLLELTGSLSGAALVAAVNRAEAQAQARRGAPTTMGRVRPQQHFSRRFPR